MKTLFFLILGAVCVWGFRKLKARIKKHHYEPPFNLAYATSLARCNVYKSKTLSQHVNSRVYARLLLGYIKRMRPCAKRKFYESEVRDIIEYSFNFR
jgi:hypothetical protein